LQTENQRLKNELETTHTQLEDEVPSFKLVLLLRFDEKSRKVFDLERTMETIFQDLVDEFGTKSDLVNDLEKEVKNLSHTENVVLKTNICRLEESNTHLANKVSHLQAFVDELREEVAPLQEDNNHLFDEYQALKEDYDAILLQLLRRMRLFRACRTANRTLKKKFTDYRMLRRRLMLLSCQAHLFFLPPFYF
jgi:chromosome segregation ATPase